MINSPTKFDTPCLRYMVQPFKKMCDGNFGRSSRSNSTMLSINFVVPVGSLVCRPVFTSVTIGETMQNQDGFSSPSQLLLGSQEKKCVCFCKPKCPDHAGVDLANVLENDRVLIESRSVDSVESKLTDL
jgi:hypothetical protein